MSFSALDLDDNFGASSRLEGKYFTVYYAPQVDPFEMVRQLGLGVSDRIISGSQQGGGGAFGEDYGSATQLAEAFDAIFLRVCAILDMPLYSFQGNIKICRDHNQLNSIYKGFFDKDLPAQSFYVYSLDTIYLSADAFKKGIVSHEIAHAVISHYFVVLPPVKIQEVLAGYVEYQLAGPRQ